MVCQLPGAEGVIQMVILPACSQEGGERGCIFKKMKEQGGGDVCLATMLTSLTTAGPDLHTHTCT